MNARRPWRLPDRFLATLAIAVGALALPAPGMADTPAAAATTQLDAIQAPADLPPPTPTLSQATTAAPSAAQAAPQGAAPEPDALYVLALVVAGLLGGWRRAFS